MTDTPRPKATADSAALPVMGLGDKLDDKPVKRSKVVAWAFWDWGLQPFHTICSPSSSRRCTSRPTSSCHRREQRWRLTGWSSQGARSPSSPAGSDRARPSPAFSSCCSRPYSGSRLTPQAAEAVARHRHAGVCSVASDSGSPNRPSAVLARCRMLRRLRAQRDRTVNSNACSSASRPRRISAASPGSAGASDISAVSSRSSSSSCSTRATGSDPRRRRSAVPPHRRRLRRLGIAF